MFTFQFGVVACLSDEGQLLRGNLAVEIVCSDLCPLSPRLLEEIMLDLFESPSAVSVVEESGCFTTNMRVLYVKISELLRMWSEESDVERPFVSKLVYQDNKREYLKVTFVPTGDEYVESDSDD